MLDPFSHRDAAFARLVARSGAVIGRYPPITSPTSLASATETALANTGTAAWPVMNPAIPGAAPL